MLENKFKTKLIKELEEMFPDSIIIHLPSDEIQGIGDILILYEDRWAVLEGKKDRNSSHRPNQDYYVNKMNRMSFAAFIYPENKKEVLDELYQTLKYGRSSRFPKRVKI
jgi:hypothetical protein